MSDILDLIDGALRDYGTSADAMRWTPEPERADVSPLAKYGVTAAEAAESFRRAGEVMRNLVPPSPSAMLPTDQLRILCGDEVVYDGPLDAWLAR